ncbi:MAG: TraB/GumN family protein, partial [Nanoarchaeota archaeon]
GQLWIRQFQLSGNFETGVDTALVNAAENIPIPPLEAMEEQLLALCPASFGENLRDLIRRSNGSPVYFHDKMQKMQAAYESATLDMNGIREMLTANQTESLLVQRNKIMVERSLPHLTHPCIIAVGLAHYVLEPSMLTLYREKGFIVNRIH